MVRRLPRVVRCRAVHRLRATGNTPSAPRVRRGRDDRTRVPAEQRHLQRTSLGAVAHHPRLPLLLPLSDGRTVKGRVAVGARADVCVCHAVRGAQSVGARNGAGCRGIDRSGITRSVRLVVQEQRVGGVAALPARDVRHAPVAAAELPAPHRRKRPASCPVGRARLDDRPGAADLVGRGASLRTVHRTRTGVAIQPVHEYVDGLYPDCRRVCRRQASRARYRSRGATRPAVPARTARAAARGRAPHRGARVHRRRSPRSDDCAVCPRHARVSVLAGGGRARAALPRPDPALARSAILPRRVRSGATAARDDGRGREGGFDRGAVAAGERSPGVGAASDDRVRLVPGSRRAGERFVLGSAADARGPAVGRPLAGVGRRARRRRAGAVAAHGRRVSRRNALVQRARHHV